MTTENQGGITNEKICNVSTSYELILSSLWRKKEEEKPAEQPAAEATATEATAEVKAFTVKTEDGKEFTLEVAADELQLL